jgi:hypothetical protein
MVPAGGSKHPAPPASRRGPLSVSRDEGNPGGGSGRRPPCLGPGYASRQPRSRGGHGSHRPVPAKRSRRAGRSWRRACGISAQTLPHSIVSVLQFRQLAVAQGQRRGKGRVQTDRNRRQRSDSADILANRTTPQPGFDISGQQVLQAHACVRNASQRWVRGGVLRNLGAVRNGRRGRLRCVPGCGPQPWTQPCQGG